MAALTAETTLRTRTRGLQAYLINNTSRVYGGALLGRDATGNAVPWTDPSPSTLSFLGLAVNVAFDTADLSHSVLGDGSKEVEVNTGGLVLEGLTVAGSPAAGTLAYCATDNISDLSTTITAGGNPVGRIIRANGSNWDVRLLTEEEARLNEGT